MTPKPAAIAAICGKASDAPAAISVASSSGQRRFTSTRPTRISGSEVAVRASRSARSIAGLAVGAAADPQRRSASPRATSRRPRARAGRRRSSPACAIVITASIVAAARADQDGRSQAGLRSAPRVRSSAVRVASSARTPSPAGTSRSASREQLGRGLVRAHADAERGRQAPLGDERAQPGERVDVGAVVARVERDVDVGARRAGGARRRPCRSGPAGAARAPSCPRWTREPVRPSASLRDLADQLLGALRVVGRAPVQRDDRALVLEPQRRPPAGGPRRRARRPRGRARSSARPAGRPRAPRRRGAAARRRGCPRRGSCPSPTIRRATAARRPLTQATNP